MMPSARRLVRRRLQRHTAASVNDGGCHDSLACATGNEVTRRAPDDGDASGLRRGLTSYGDKGFSLFLRKAFIKGAGYTDGALDRPVIGITATGSAYNPCHGNAPQLIEAVKRGVMLAGGLAMEFPTMSLHESFSAPTSMFLRNLMAMETEELLRAQPLDAVVLNGGCDKTVPAQLMGAASAGLPAVQLVTGAMLTGSHRGERVGA
jgi:dihydroxy-acid dehydratase